LRRAPRWLIPLGVVVIGTVIVGVVANLPDPPHSQSEVTVPPVNVTVQVVKPIERLRDAFVLSAVVEPNQVVELAAEVPGRIERYGARGQAVSAPGKTWEAGSIVAEGEPVTLGDPIVHLNDELLRAQFDRAQAQYDFDLGEFTRILAMLERGTTNQTELNQARMRRDVSKAALDEAARQLERSTIVAPLSGILNRLPLEIGEYAGAGDAVAEIVDIDTVKVVVEIPEREVFYFSVGGEVELLVRAPDESVVLGHITYMSQLADPQTRATPVEVTVANSDRQLRSGQIVRARLTRRWLNDVIMVPLDAVIPLEAGRAVYVVEDGRAQRRDVELGLIQGREIHVTRGLAAGDQLIIAGQRYVSPGQAVSVIAPKGEEP